MGESNISQSKAYSSIRELQNRDINYDGFEEVFLSYFEKAKSDLIIYMLEVTGLTPEEYIEKNTEIIHIHEGEGRLGFSSEYFANDFDIKCLTRLVMMEVSHGHVQMKDMFKEYLETIDYLKQAEIQEVITSSKYSSENISDFLSKNGKRGAEKRNQGRLKLIDYALLLASGFPTQKSASSIAYEIQDKVLAKGIEVGYTLTPQNAKSTIQNWINEDRNKSK